MNVKDKIAKLLALAGNNPERGEAEAAILRARELMAKYKLRPDECVPDEKKRVVRSLVGVRCTARTNAWTVTLSAIIAEHYCCVAYRNHVKGRQTQDIGFIGLEDDFEIASRIFRYAHDCVSSECERIFYEDADFLPADYRRKAAEAYGWGFCRGLDEKLKKQNEEHQEWGLVLVTPKEVQDAVGDMKGSSYGKARFTNDAAVRAGARGYIDGQKFDPSTKLAEAAAPAQICG